MVNKKKRIIPGWVRIVILLAALCLVIGVYFGLSAYNDKQADEESSLTEILTLDTSDVVSFTYELDGVVYTFEREDSESDWVYLQDPSLGLDQDTVTDMLSTGTSVSTEKTVEDSLDKASEYGFDNPVFTLTMTMKDGAVKKLRLGTLNPMTSEYYANIEGDERIFTLGEDFLSSFTTAEELADASSLEDSSLSVY